MSALIALVGAACLIGQVNGFPMLYNSRAICEGPTTALGKHGAPGTTPVANLDISFIIKVDGEETTELMSGVEHLITIPSFGGPGQPAHTWLHASAGTFTTTEGVTVATACEQAAYTADRTPAPEATFTWSGTVTSGCLTLTATSALGSAFEYNQNSIELCPAGVSPSPQAAPAAGSTESAESTEGEGEGTSGVQSLLGGFMAAVTALVAAVVL